MRTMLLVLAIVGATTIAISVMSSPTQDKGKSEARTEIESLYVKWGKARVATDKKALTSMMTDDFKVTISGADYTGEQFMEMVGDPDDENQRMKRFDVTVLSVQKDKIDWVAVIEEKLEYEVKNPEGKWEKIYSLWITKDGFRQVEGKWKFTGSEAIGWENWRNEKPPFKDW